MFDPILIPFQRDSAVRQIRHDELGYAERMGYEPWFFTFGSGQAFPGGVVCVWAPDRNGARQKMEQLFGIHWSFDYDLEAMAEYVSKWHPFLVGEYIVD